MSTQNLHREVANRWWLASTGHDVGFDDLDQRIQPHARRVAQKIRQAFDGNPGGPADRVRQAAVRDLNKHIIDAGLDPNQLAHPRRVDFKALLDSIPPVA